jgi:hypothetical protein
MYFLFQWYWDIFSIPFLQKKQSENKFPYFFAFLKVNEGKWRQAEHMTMFEHKSFLFQSPNFFSHLWQQQDRLSKPCH